MLFKSNFTIPAVAAISFCLIGGTVPAVADILHVPGDFLTIQEAIIAAMDGDEVEVHPGTYNEIINFLGKAITVRSSDGADATTIDGTGLWDTVVKCLSGEGPDTILDGFTITGGNASSGGGMRNINSSPTVINCTFSGNEAGDNGGGMYNDNSNPTVTNCTFSGNVAFASHGGGMCNSFSNPIVKNCTFIANWADECGWGGGMVNMKGSSPTITNCTFSGNYTYPCKDETTGGGILNWNGSPTVTDCTFIGNMAERGGGMGSFEGSSPTVINCTFSGNMSYYEGGGMLNQGGSATVTNCSFSGNLSFGAAGGMYNIVGSTTVTNCVFRNNIAFTGGGILNDSSSPEVTNCLFTGNTAAGSGGGISNFANSDPAITNCTFSNNNAFDGAAIHNFASVDSPTIANCIMWGNTVTNGHPSIGGDGTPIVSYSDVEAGFDGMGNIEVDPLFVDPDNDDYHISPTSPCIDAAANTLVPKGIVVDLDDNPRFIEDPDTPDTGLGDCPIVDMGAYEFQGTCPWDLDCNGSVGVGDLLLLLANWGNPYGVSDLVALLANWGPCP